VNKRMMRNHNFAGNILLACQRLRKNGCEQIVRPHALNGWRNFFTAHEPQESKRATGRPSPARREDRRIQDRLLEQMLKARGVQEAKNIGERKTVLLAQRNIQTIVGGRGLKLKIKRTAEAFA